MKYILLASSLLAVSSATAALTSISAVTDTSGTLNSVTMAGVEYTSLFAATSFTENANSGGYLGTGTAATDIDEALSGLNMYTGTLNTDFEAQFGGNLTDSAQIILMANQSTSDQSYFGTAITVFALDATGTQLGSFNLDLSQFDAVVNGGTDPSAALYTNSTFQRSTGGTLARTIYGASFTLADLGLDGLSATGIEILTTGIGTGSYTLDTQLIGLATIPEPSAFALLAGSLAFLSIAMKRRR